MNDIRSRDNGRPSHKRTKLNQEEDQEQVRRWVANEDNFALQQLRKGATIRIKEERAKPIDWIALNICIIDPQESFEEDDTAIQEVIVPLPDEVIDGLSLTDLKYLESDAETYLQLEEGTKVQEYWEVRI